MAYDQDTRALQEELRKLQQDFAFTKKEVADLKNNQLRYPVDANTQRIIDGLVDTRLKSILYDTLWRKTFHWYEPFDAIDNWDAVNTVVDPLATGAAIMTTAGTTGSFATLARRLLNYSAVNPFDYDSSFRVSFYIKQGPESSTYLLVVGDGITGAAGISQNFYGFTIEDGKLYGIITKGDGTDTWTLTNQLATIKNKDTSGESYVLEARYYTGVKVDFFVTVYPQSTTQVSQLSSVPVATLRSTIPRPSFLNVQDTPYVFSFIAGTKEDVVKDLYLHDLNYIQRLDLQ